MKTPIPLKRVAEYGTGKGGIVVMPLARKTVGANMANSAGGGETLDFDEEMFASIIDNFHQRPGPVPVYPGHIPKAERKTKPAWGDVRDVFMEGDLLMGMVYLTPAGWDAVVMQGGFFGGSIEADFSPPTVTGSPQGWTLTGHAVTNTPALDVHYVSLEKREGGAMSIAASLRLEDAPAASGKEKTQMKEISLETVQAENKSLQDSVTTLQAENGEIKAQLAAAKADQESVKTLRAEVAQLRANGEKIEILAAVNDAKNSGVDPAVFDGADEDPVKFVATHFGGSVSSLKATVARLPKMNMSRQVGSGSDNQPGDPQTKLQVEVQKHVATGKTFLEAMEIVKNTNRELYAAGVEGYRPAVVAS